MKKWAKILCCLSLFVLVLTGCCGAGTVSNIRNTQEGIIYNGNIAARVGDYLYFSNSYQNDFTDDASYKSAASVGFLGRVNLNNLKAQDDVHSPKEVGNVTSEVVGNDNSFMFVLGQSIYYATPNTQMLEVGEDDYQHNYRYTKLYRSDLDGKNKKNFFTSTAEVKNIEALKYGNNYYIVMLAGTELVAVNLANNKPYAIASDVTSVAIPKTMQQGVKESLEDWNGYLYFTQNYTDENNSGAQGTVVKRIALSGGDEKLVASVDDTISFIDRDCDIVFYTKGSTSYYSNVAADTKDYFDSFNVNEKNLFNTTVTDVRVIKTTVGGETTQTLDLGYVFLSGGSLAYNFNGKKGAVVMQNGTETALSSYNVLVACGESIYVSTTSGIYKVNLSKLSENDGKASYTTIATMTNIYNGDLYSFDGNYLYVYARLQDLHETDNSDDVLTSTDETYYLYRVLVDGSGTFQLLSYVAERATK